MNLNPLAKEWTERKTIDINLCSANLGSRAHEVAQVGYLSGDKWKTRIQNYVCLDRTLENCLPRTFGSVISKYDILCHQEVAMPRGTARGLTDDIFDHFGDFDYVSKHTGHVWMIRKSPGCHDMAEQVFHGTTVGWNRKKFKKVGFVLGTELVERRSTSWIILESLVVKYLQIVVSSVHLPVDDGKSRKNKDMWRALKRDITSLRQKGYLWIFVAGDFNKNYAATLSKESSLNLVGSGVIDTNVNVSYYDTTHHPDELKLNGGQEENCYAIFPTLTSSAVDFQFVAGDNVSVLSGTIYQKVSPRNLRKGLLTFDYRYDMIRDYDHSPILSTIRLDFT